jgi:exo-beta-1,3-glucanase (GH17 family)
MSSKDFQSTVLRPMAAIAILFVGCSIALSWWWARGRVISLPTVPSAQMQRFDCVSYSPFRHPLINPFNYLASVSAAQIEADLTILKARTNCIRTYGLTQGLDSVPAVARKLGLRVKLGIWLARDAQQNQAQLTKGLALARQYPDVIDLLVVGNEVLLRRELTVEQLGSILKATKAQSPVPITYADVWEFWQRNATLAQHVDVVTVHILPYWEDEPVAVHAAAQHVQDIAKKMQLFFNPKPVWVGETGWPAAGRQRDGAVPGVVEQSAFFRDLLLLRSDITQQFNVIEAFDQPWKRSFEGAMGGYWGLFDAEGKARVSLTGDVVEDVHWWHGLAGAALGGLIGVLLTSFKSARNLRVVTVGVIAGGLLGSIMVTQWLMSRWWDRSAFELTVSVGLGFIGFASAVLSLAQLIGVLNANRALSSVRNNNATWLAKLSDQARLAILFCAASAALIMLLDPRYRPFAWWWFLAPTVCWLALRVLTNPTVSRQTQFLACALALAAAGFMIQEGWRNAQALCYGLMFLSLAAVASWPTLANTSATSKAACSDDL